MPTFYITKNTTSVVCPTLVEKSLLSEELRGYIWKVQHDQLTDPVYFTCQELSTELQRYNKFNIVEKSNPDPFQGETELQVGQHSYKIYEVSLDDILNIVDFSLIDYSLLNLVEQGILKCEPSAVTNTEYPETVINTVYS